MEFMCREMEQIYNEGFEVGEKLGIEKGELKKAKEIALSLAQSEFPINKIAQIVQIRNGLMKIRALPSNFNSDFE